MFINFDRSMQNLQKLAAHFIIVVRGKLYVTRPPAGGGRYKYLQVDWPSPIHGSWATALKCPLREVEARDLVLSIS